MLFPTTLTELRVSLVFVQQPKHLVVLVHYKRCLDHLSISILTTWKLPLFQLQHKGTSVRRSQLLQLEKQQQHHVYVLLNILLIW